LALLFYNRYGELDRPWRDCFVKKLYLDGQNKRGLGAAMYRANGKFYLYVPIHGEGIAVLVSDSPTGPFSDPIGKRLVDSDHVWQDIDPTVAIDDNGQAYLYWGNPKLWYVKLNEDMVSYDRSVGENGIVSIDMTAEAFGSKEGRDGKPGTTYTEGPWLYKRNSLWYMVYAAAGIPEYIAYSTATSPEGPWTYKGFIMERAPQLAFTNHAGIIDFKGNSYFFYHDQDLSKGQGLSVRLAWSNSHTTPMAAFRSSFQPKKA
jgi:arabinoxylan arabinofuranohydrolase